MTVTDTPPSPADLLGATLSEIAEASHGKTDHYAMTKALLCRLQEKGLTLEQCAARQIMNRSLRTLKAYVREFDLAFPDYVPRKLQMKKPMAARP